MKKMLLVSMFQIVLPLLKSIEPNLKNKTITYIPTAYKVENLRFLFKLSKLGLEKPVSYTHLACRCPQMNPVLTPVPAFHIHMKQIITHPIRCRGTHSNLSFGSCYCGHEISLIAKGKQKLPRIIKHICQGISAFFRHADIPLRINAHKQLPFNAVSYTHLKTRIEFWRAENPFPIIPFPPGPKLSAAA